MVPDFEGNRNQLPFMGREYKILCKPADGAALQQLLRKLPPPFCRQQMQEIYNYRVEEEGCYLVDRPAAVALQVFLDAALSTGETATVIEP